MLAAKTPQGRLEGGGLAKEERVEIKNDSKIPAAPGAVKPDVSMLEAALRYTRNGVRIFPVSPRTKAPYVKNNLTVATTDPDTIRDWWTRWPNAAIGCPAGENGLVVLDLDGADGISNFEKLRAKHGIVTPQGAIRSRTGGGGQHIFMAMPTGADIRSNASKLAPKVDVRASGGYVILPPSLHPSGNRYAWEPGFGIDGLIPAILPAPCAKLVELLTRGGASTARADAPTTSPACALDTPAVIAWAEHYLEHEAPAPDEGERNSTLFKVACRLKEAGLSLGALQEAILATWNQKLAVPLDEDEIATTCRSAWKTSRNKPGALSVERFDIVAEDTAPGETPVRAGDLAAPDERRGPRAFGFASMEELFTKPRPPRWLVENILEEDTLACLFGESGAMKSFLALDLGLSIASGRPWHGHRVTNAGPVLYIAGEGHQGIARRLRAWAVDHGISAASFHVSRVGAQLNDATGFNAVVAAIEDFTAKHSAPRLIIIDTLSRNFGPGSENDSEAMASFVARLDQLRAICGSAIMVIHHVGLGDKDRARGSSVFRAAMDAEFRLAKQGALRILACTKMKDHDAPPDMAFTPRQVETGWTDGEGRPICSIVLDSVDLPGRRAKSKLTKAQHAAFDALAAAVQEGGPCSTDEWRRRAYAAGISTGGPEAKQKAFTRSTAALESDGFIERVGEDSWQPKRLA